MKETDNDELKRKIDDLKMKSSQSVSLVLKDGTRRDITVSMAKKVTIFENEELPYTRVYLCEKDLESGHMYIDVVSPKPFEIIELLNVSLYGIKIINKGKF